MFVVSVLQAASPLVHSSDIYQGQQVENGSHSHTQGNRSISTPIQQHSYHHNYVDIEEQEYPDFDIDTHPQYFHQYYHQPYPLGENSGRMTGNNGFSNNSPGVLMKSKSGSLPGRYSARGFRDTFISSMNHPNSVSANSSPQHVAMAPNQNIGETHTPTSTPTKDPQKDSSGKKWSFGGLFKRKVKSSNSQYLSPSPNPNVLGTPSPLSASFSSPSPAPSANATANITTNNLSTPVHQGISRTKYLATRKTKLSESDISSYDSENETENNYIANQKRRANGQIPPQQPLSFKQNFLTRRLSKRKEKAAKKAAMSGDNSHNGFLKVPSSQLQNGRRVGSSPDSLNNSGAGMNGPWQIWETTKKVPANNYSSSGSLSLSIEGSSKGSRAAAKEAVKARAVARRESYFHESSSSNDEETGDTEERSRSSLQGSHSSLSSRTRRPRGLNYQTSASRRPELIRGSPSSPVVSHILTSFNEPTANAQQSNLIAPGSPRWEARIIYQQETLVESDGPLVKLPKNRGMINSNENQQMHYPQQNHAQQNVRQSASPHGNILLSTSTNSDDQQGGQSLPVITAGLRVPLLVQNQNNANPNPNAYMTEEVTYANLPQGANNNGNRSITPYNVYSVSPSPPPPPPRRDFTRNHPNQNQHPNFYRPVSCSYLDSYQYQQQHGTNSPYLNGTQLNNSPNRNSSYYNNNNNNSYHQEHVNGNGNGGDVDSTADGVTNGYFEHEIEVEPSAVEFSPRNNNFLAPPSYAHHLGRSPSEPPEIKVQFARDTPQNRVASPSPYINNWNSEMNGNTSSPTKYNNQHQPVIMSKLGFPIRRLHEANKLPPIQTPVHLRASEFWRRKEQEVSSSATNNGTSSQKRFLSRVRSADSSPLPVPRMRNSPATMLNSNESISSLSSFSAEAPSPNLFSTPKSSKIQSGPLRPQTLVLKTPGFQINKQKDKESSKSKEKVQSQSACERLKVRLPNGQSPSTTPIPTTQLQPQQEQQQQPPAHTQTTNNNKDPATVKSPGRNLEDALNELEDMYKSLRLSDEDLLDRAERRDLPTAHQELRNAPMLPQTCHFSPPGSVESLATGSSSFHSTENLNRVRAPPLRRSSRPDIITDDMAKRRFDHPDHPPNDPRSVVSKTGSYMILSPAFSPPSSPCPPTPGVQASVHSLLGYEDPDLTLDDVTFRNYKRANSIRIIEPQPPFGIPNVPVAPAPDSDYLHSKPVEKFRPLFRHTKRPDVVKDDIAFRNLRKDLNQENNLSKDWTPRLFSPTRENVFTYNIKPEQKSKKLRAIRSLSANISHLIPFKESAVNCEIGKWNSFTDLNCDESPAGSRASSYLQPSWVEQIEKVQTSTETLTENRGANSRFTLEDRRARKLVTPIIPHDPSKPRRPWTDILLESFEREKQAEIERIAAESAAAAQAASEKATLEQKASIQLSQLYQENSLDDDDVFEDAREESKSTSPDDLSKTRSRYATPEITSASVVHPFAFHLLAGQKNRRGSWVESKSSSLFHSDNDEDQRRRSWSDVPKDIGAGSAFLFHCPPNSPAKKTLFNPLPPPRKIKQINLNAFNTGSSKQQQQPILSEGEGEIEAELESLSAIQRKWENYAQSTADEEKSEENNKLTMNSSQPAAVSVSCEEKEPKYEKEMNENSKCSQIVSNNNNNNNNNAVSSPSPTHKRLTTNRVLSPKSILAPKSPTKGEDELNELMDALLREADTCGPPTTTRRRIRPSSRAKQEISTTSGNEKVILEESTSSTTGPTASSVVVPANEVTMPKGNSVPLPKIPSKESVFEKVGTTTTNTGSSVIIPTSTSENIDNNKPCMGKVPKTDSIEDLIDSINESLPELEASCFKNNTQPNSSSTSSECYIVSSTTTSKLLPPPCLDSLKQSQELHKEILPQQPENQSSYLSNTENKNNTNNTQQNQRMPPDSTDTAVVVAADENENLPVLGKNDNFQIPSSNKENQTSDPLYSRRPSSAYLDQLDIIDDDFQQQSKQKMNINGNRRGSDNTNNAPSSSSSSSFKPTNAAGVAADALTKSKQEGEQSELIDEGLFGRWNGVLLVACYLLAFIHSIAHLEMLPALGIFLAVFVFFVHLL